VHINLGLAPSLRLAVRFHQVRRDVLDAPDDAARLVVLSDAEAALRSLMPFNERHGHDLAEADRMTSVSQIGALVGIYDLSSNTQLTPEFFDPVEGEQ
jgi:hypothetical protein